jgi:ubiquinone biosynthesis protein COQ9
MNLKTEAQLRQEISVLWRMLDMQRDQLITIQAQLGYAKELLKEFNICLSLSDMIELLIQCENFLKYLGG